MGRHPNHLYSPGSWSVAAGRSPTAGPVCVLCRGGPLNPQGSWAGHIKHQTQRRPQPTDQGSALCLRPTKPNAFLRKISAAGAACGDSVNYFPLVCRPTADYERVRGYVALRGSDKYALIQGLQCSVCKAIQHVFPVPEIQGTLASTVHVSCLAWAEHSYWAFAWPTGGIAHSHKM